MRCAGAGDATATMINDPAELFGGFHMKFFGELVNKARVLVAQHAPLRHAHSSGVGNNRLLKRNFRSVCKAGDHMR